MIVCHCHAVNDRDIRRAIDSGASSCSEIKRACKAGGDCNGCQPHVHMILETARRQTAATTQAAG